MTSRGPSLDVTKLTSSQAVEMSSVGISFVLEVPWDLVDALHDAQADFARLDTPETISFALRDWLTGHGYLPTPAEPS